MGSGRDEERRSPGRDDTTRGSLVLRGCTGVVEPTSNEKVHTLSRVGRVRRDTNIDSHPPEGRIRVPTTGAGVVVVDPPFRLNPLSTEGEEGGK